VSDATAAASPDPAPEGIRRRAVRVLLVDDQPIIGEAVRRMLASEADVELHFCSDPTRALGVASEVAPTVILTDLVMPQMSGLDLVRTFRANEGTRRIPLIVLSTKEEPRTKADAFATGANDYLVKLPDRIELLARIRHHSEGYVHLLERDDAYGALLESQRALRAELGEAANYVRSLLPSPVRDGLRVDWRFETSTALGGDAFGYHWLDPDHFVLYLLDVSGHGVGSALLSVSVLNLIRSQSLAGTDFRNPGSVVGRLNDAFPTQAQSGKFFTIWYGVFQPSTRRLRWSGAGHPAALYFPRPHEDAFPYQLESSGPVPGIVPGLQYDTREREIAPGGRLLVFSDGVFEVRRADGRVLEYGDFLGAMSDPQRASARTLDGLLAYARQAVGAGDLADDVSIVQVDL
jgi:sigma-B regulation protein RsbU (phosphoserine phosphatase)